MVNEFEAMSHFPFYVEIWGTVSDWVMIFVTAFTALYLVKTFRQQNTALEMERYRFSMSIRPSFSAKLNLYEPLIKLNEEGKIKVNLVIKVENHRALMEKIEVEVSHIVTSENLHTPFTGSRWMEVGALWDISFVFFEQEKIGNNFLPVSPSINIYFRDIEQRQFKQLVFLRTKPELKLYLHPPEELNENKL
jgi:hypothetical protein